MTKPSDRSPECRLRVVLSALRGVLTAAETALRGGVAEWATQHRRMPLHHPAHRSASVIIVAAELLSHGAQDSADEVGFSARRKP